METDNEAAFDEDYTDLVDEKGFDAVDVKQYEYINTLLTYEMLAKPMIEAAMKGGDVDTAMTLTLITEPLKKQYDALPNLYNPIYADEVLDFMDGDKFMQRAYALLLGCGSKDYITFNQMKDLKQYFKVDNGLLKCIYSPGKSKRPRKIEIPDRLTCVIAYAIKRAAYLEKHGNVDKFKMNWQLVEKAFVFYSTTTIPSQRPRLDSPSPPPGYDEIREYLLRFGIDILPYDQMRCRDRYIYKAM